MPRPAKNKVRLTERRVTEHIRSGAGSEVILWDSQCPGLGLRKTSWVVRVQPRGGKQITRSIAKATGPGSLSLTEARELAAKRITEIRGGDDSKASVMTVLSEREPNPGGRDAAPPQLFLKLLCDLS